MADFGADHPFAPAAAKLKEHYGIDVPVSTGQRTMAYHAQCIYEQEAAREIAPGTSAECFIGEIDGSMVPVVESSATSTDRRKGKMLVWKEARLNLVHRHGRVSPVFGGHFAGGRGKWAAMVALRHKSRVRPGQSPAWTRRRGAVDCESVRSPLRDPRALFDRFLPWLRL